MIRRCLGGTNLCASMAAFLLSISILLSRLGPASSYSTSDDEDGVDEFIFTTDDLPLDAYLWKGSLEDDLPLLAWGPPSELTVDFEEDPDMPAAITTLTWGDELTEKGMRREWEKTPFGPHTRLYPFHDNIQGLNSSDEKNITGQQFDWFD